MQAAALASLLAVAGALVVPAPAGGSGPGGAPQAQYRPKRAARSALTVAFPTGWSALNALDARFPGTVETLLAWDPTVGALVRGLALPEGGMLLLAFDRASTAGSLSLAVVSDSGPAASGWEAAARRRVEGSPTVVGPVSAKLVALPAGPALRLRYTRLHGPGARPFATLEYVVQAAGRLYTLSYATEGASVPAAHAGSARTFSTGRAGPAPPPAAAE